MKQLQWTVICCIVMMALTGASPPLEQTDQSVPEVFSQAVNSACSSEPYPATPAPPASLGILDTDGLRALARQFATELNDVASHSSPAPQVNQVILDFPRRPEIWIYLPLLCNVRIHAIDEKGQQFDLVRFTKATLWHVPFNPGHHLNLKTVCYHLQPFGDYYLMGPVMFKPHFYAYARLLKVVPLYRFIGVRLVVEYTGRITKQIRVLEFDHSVTQKRAEESHLAATKEWARQFGTERHL